MAITDVKKSTQREIELMNESTTVLHIPKTNIFSAENIKKIMDCVKSGGDLHAL